MKKPKVIDGGAEKVNVKASADLRKIESLILSSSAQISVIREHFRILAESEAEPICEEDRWHWATGIQEICDSVMNKLSDALGKFPI